MVGSNFMDLPEGIDEVILSKIPARELYMHCMFVCRAWYDIISRLNIIHEQHQQIIIGTRATCDVHNPNYKTTRKLQIELNSDGYNCKMKESGLARGARIIDSCNGLVLVNNMTKSAVFVAGRRSAVPVLTGNLQIMNIVTGECVIIPTPPPCGCEHYNKDCTIGLGYDPITNTYKVVHLYVFSLGFEVFTVHWPPGPVQPDSEEGKWRSVPGPWHDDCNGKGVLNVLDNPEPVSAGSVLHWSNGLDKYIVSIDVGDEQNPYRTAFPVTGSQTYNIRRDGDDPYKKRRRFSLVEINGNLSFLHNVSDTKIDVWNLTKEPRNARRVWSKKHSIDVDTLNYLNSGKDPLPKFSQFSAVCSLGEDGHVLVLKHYGSYQLYVYDGRCNANVLQKVKLSMDFKKDQFFIPHRTSFSALKSLKALLN